MATEFSRNVVHNRMEPGYEVLVRLERTLDDNRDAAIRINGYEFETNELSLIKTLKALNRRRRRMSKRGDITYIIQNVPPHAQWPAYLETLFGDQIYLEDWSWTKCTAINWAKLSKEFYEVHVEDGEKPVPKKVVMPPLCPEKLSVTSKAHVMFMAPPPGFIYKHLWPNCRRLTIVGDVVAERIRMRVNDGMDGDSITATVDFTGEGHASNRIICSDATWVHLISSHFVPNIASTRNLRIETDGDNWLDIVRMMMTAKDLKSFEVTFKHAPTKPVDVEAFRAIVKEAGSVATLTLGSVYMHYYPVREECSEDDENGPSRQAFDWLVDISYHLTSLFASVDRMETNFSPHVGVGCPCETLDISLSRWSVPLEAPTRTYKARVGHLQFSGRRGTVELASVLDVNAFVDLKTFFSRSFWGPVIGVPPMVGDDKIALEEPPAKQLRTTVTN